ncbi:MAG: phage holin family protein [Paracoccus sp. (in: a-proteobacteria)]|uniref:phage holin family protein n=1 Tax=Paracoccus sp. TaxID=267 RepID=UPI0026DF570C|nr:phage holin family protein [Paracoccus sp. (in: a-proteobacteria)]MDO5621381.1 phage holin family protein [Paracoccus sp. (in: a-proteobacteria)]
MFDYVRNMQLALTDTARRTAIKAGAGVVAAIGAGYLLAALWTWLAVDLDWGATLASATIGGVFMVIGVAVLLLAGKPRHQAPTTDDLKREVEARLSLAADAASDRVTATAQALADGVSQKVHAFTDRFSFGASSLADRAESRAYQAARKAADTADRAGLNRETLDQVEEQARRGFNRAKASRHGPAAGVLGALALGLVLADRFSRRDEDDWPDDHRG